MNELRNERTSPWMKAPAGLALALALMTPASIVRADPEPEVSEPEPEVSSFQLRWNRLLAAELTAAIDGPLGVIGASMIIAPTTNFQLELGGGASRDGGRVAGGARFVLPQDHFALVLRVGFAGGPLTWEGASPAQDPGLGPTRRRWDFAGFVYSDVGLQYRFDMGLYVMINGGVETALVGDADTCMAGTTTCSTSGASPARIYAGLTVGYAFDMLQP
jgi:hypothetical protein